MRKFFAILSIPGFIIFLIALAMGESQQEAKEWALGLGFVAVLVLGAVAAIVFVVLMFIPVKDQQPIESRQWKDEYDLSSIPTNYLPASPTVTPWDEMPLSVTAEATIRAEAPYSAIKRAKLRKAVWAKLKSEGRISV